MKRKKKPDSPGCLSVDVFQPNPDVLYTLDVAAHLADVSRRSVLIYCRAGLVQPVFLPPYGVMAFTEETIHTIRRMERLRAVHGIGMDWIKTLFDLLNEVDRLRAEVRDLRSR